MESVDLTQVPVVDNHCHGILRDQTFGNIASWRGAFTESTDPGMARDHVATTALYRRLIANAGRLLRLRAGRASRVRGPQRGRTGESSPPRCFVPRTSIPCSSTRAFRHPQEVLPVPELGEFGGCRAEPMLRLEVLMEACSGKRLPRRDRGGARRRTARRARPGLRGAQEHSRLPDGPGYTGVATGGRGGLVPRIQARCRSRLRAARSPTLARHAIARGVRAGGAAGGSRPVPRWLR